MKNLAIICIISIMVLLASIFAQASGRDILWGLSGWKHYGPVPGISFLLISILLYAFNDRISGLIISVASAVWARRMAASWALMYMSCALLFSTLIMPALAGEDMGFVHRTLGSIHLAYFFISSYPHIIIPLSAIAPLIIIPLARRSETAVRISMACSLFCLFWVFRSNTMIGDGCEIGIFIDGFSARITSILTRYLFLLNHRLMGPHGFDPYTSISLVSCLAGALYIHILYSISQMLAMGRYRRLFFFAYAATAGLSQLLFGWVEEYTVVLACFSAFIWASISHMRRGTSILPPAFIFSLTCFFHISALLYSPLIVALAMLAMRGHTRHQALKIFAALVLAMLLPGIILYATLVAENRGPHYNMVDKFQQDILIKSWAEEGSKRYSLFSHDHVSMLFNVLAVSTPISLPLLILAILIYRGRIGWRDGTLLFFLGATALSFLHLLLITPGFDVRVDWDQYAISLLPLTLASGYLFSMYSSRATFRIAGPLLLAVNLMHLAPLVFDNYMENSAFCRLKAFRREMLHILEGIRMPDARRTYL